MREFREGDFKRIVVGPLETNVYILSSENESVIIDPGAEADKIIAASNGLEVRPLSVKFILLTHNHFDHVQALIDVKNALKVRAGIHKLDKTSNIFDFEFNDGNELKFGKALIKVIHTPGHTPGSCCFLVENILFGGDTIFLGSYGNTAFPGGNESNILKSIKDKIMTLPPDTKIYPGHGPPTTVSKEMPFYY